MQPSIGFNSQALSQVNSGLPQQQFPNQFGQSPFQQQQLQNQVPFQQHQSQLQQPLSNMFGTAMNQQQQFAQVNGLQPISPGLTSSSVNSFGGGFGGSGTSAQGFGSSNVITGSSVNGGIGAYNANNFGSFG